MGSLVFVVAVVLTGSLFLGVVVVTLLQLYYYTRPWESLLVLYMNSYLINNDRIIVWKKISLVPDFFWCVL